MKNKWMLVWNIVVTLLLLLTLVSACTTSDTQVSWLITQVQTQAATIAQLQGTVDQNSQAIQSLSIQLVAMQAYSQSGVSQLEQVLQAYIATHP